MGNYETHPSKRVFQALRIEVNKELDVLEKTIPLLLDILNKEGRIAIITFHSLEDRIVKSIFQRESKIVFVLKNYQFVFADIRRK